MISPRFANDFVLVGDITVTPDDGILNVGSFTLGAGEDILWVGVQQLSPADPGPFSYGIFGFKTANGYELGTQKIWPSNELSVSRLSVGLAPALQTGFLTFEPRSFNLRWVSAGTPWTLRFFARGGTSSVSPDPGVVASFADSSDGGGLSLVQVDYSGRIK
jgi:hypothetical protein|tara:strand:- start:2900 stop:3382 length:483 start_codon:yes stop_codon:yes gene_type:complete